jgi:hypothetical protein
MLRSTASKVMWVGRATAFLIGLAVILGLLLGVASTALGANGKPFILGESSAATAMSKLAGKVPGGPALKVANTETDAGSKGLAVTVADGMHPIVVNATAGKATNLNADELDGMSSTDFYAEGSKVADSEHADQADSATNATSAQNASNSDNAANADLLDGQDATDLVPGGTLPEGTTIRGFYDIEWTADVAEDYQAQPISFGYALQSEPVAHYIAVGETAPAECPGTAQNPQAAPGHLCVYEFFAKNIDTFNSEYVCGLEYCPAAERSGASLSVRSAAAGFATVRGQWAVTAPAAGP